MTQQFSNDWTNLLDNTTTEPVLLENNWTTTTILAVAVVAGVSLLALLIAANVHGLSHCCKKLLATDTNLKSTEYKNYFYKHNLTCILNFTFPTTSESTWIQSALECITSHHFSTKQLQHTMNRPPTPALTFPFQPQSSTDADASDLTNGRSGRSSTRNTQQCALPDSSFNDDCSLSCQCHAEQGHFNVVNEDSPEQRPGDYRTECETENKPRHGDLKRMRHLSRSIAVLTATGLDRLRSMTVSNTSISSESIMDASDVSSNLDNISEHASTTSATSLSQKALVIDMNLSYVLSEFRLAIRIADIRGISSKVSNVQLRMLLTPERKQRHRSKLYAVTDGAVQLFETFLFAKIKPGELRVSGLRFRLYSVEMLRREKLLGEVHLNLGSLDLDMQKEQQFLLNLEPPPPKKKLDMRHHQPSDKRSLALEDISTQARGIDSKQLSTPPSKDFTKLFLGLSYNQSTGRLVVEVIETISHTEDFYVKILLLSHTEQELGREKTTMKKRGNVKGPESFIFKVLHFQISYVTLELSVVQKRSLKRKETVGQLSIGYTNSTKEAAQHWKDMRDAKTDQVCRWHLLHA